MAVGSEMADFVLVHSAWFGGWCWKKLVPLLAEHGYSVHTPTLTGLGERSHLAHPGIVLQTHVDDVVNMLTYEDLRGVILVGTSSSGAVITGVADRVPDRISQLIYVDAFVPSDGQALWDLIPPQRRPAMETLLETEGFGWLLPRMAARPWEQFAREAWQVTDDADLTWMLTRLRPTPFGHFTSPVRLVNPAAERLPRTYIRCRGWPNPSFDRYAQTASQDPRWRFHQLDSGHLPYITSPDQLAAMLLQPVASSGDS
jgi:pimeloyl-ACP methyl ester carboxylesterase